MILPAPFLSKRSLRLPWLVNPLPQWTEFMDLNLRIIHAREFLKTTPTHEVDLESSKKFFLKLAQANAAPQAVLKLLQ